MRKILALFIALLSFSAACAFSPDDIASFSFPNGLRLYVLSDTTAAPVRIALQVRAGYAAQTERTAGFFPLYARLVGAEISADAVRLVRTVAPKDVEDTLAALSAVLAPPAFSDEALRDALGQMQTEAAAYAASRTGFVNMAIDARMFPAAPWQTERGANPAQLASATPDSARAILHDIAATYYVPQNTTLFISGNISVQAAQSLVQAYFGAEAGAAAPVSRPVASAPEPRKYVLTDDSLSADVTHVVMQYAHLSMDEADVIAAALNDNGSSYKRALTAESSLALVDAEYVSATSAQRYGSSRLIVQSLFDKGKASPCAQAETFLRMTDKDGVLTGPEVRRALAHIAVAFRRHADDSAALMEQLDSWLSLVPYGSVASLFARPSALAAQLSAAQLESRLRARQPSVFVLVNTKVYAACAKEFEQAGYEVVTAKNAAWYTQPRVQEASAQDAAAQIERTDAQDDGARAAERFVAENKAQIESFVLTNGIPVVVKQTPRAQTTAIALTIRGGERLFAQDAPGLCTILTDALAVHVRRAVDARVAGGLLSDDIDIRATTSAAWSVLTVTCATVEVRECIRAVAEALVYGDITPALADGITYDERTQWRIRSGATTFQLLCAAMRTLYAADPYRNLFDDTKDKPVTMDFARIAAAYPLLLDASRFSLVLAGGVADMGGLAVTLEQTFGALLSQDETAASEMPLAPPELPRRVQRVPLRHLFLTDVTADKAGPRPSVLVPTKEFADPALYCIPAPARAAHDAALFNALLYEIAERMQEKLGAPVHADAPDSDMPFARLSVQNVTRTSRADAAYKAVIAELTEDLQSLAAAQDGRLLADLERRWLMRELSATGTALGTAELVQAGTMSGNPTRYLDDYATISAASAQAYLAVMTAYFADLPGFRLYSADSPQ